MNRMNILAVANSSFFSPLMVMLDSFLMLHKDIDVTVFLAYEDLSEDEIDSIRRLADIFSDKAARKTLVPVYVGEEFKKRVPERNGFPAEVCYRILALMMLPEDVDRILYLDADMIIKGRLEGLYRTELDGYQFAACEDITGIINGFHSMNKKRLGIPTELTYFNSGVILFNVNKMLEQGMAQKLIEGLYANPERYEYPDQDILNEMCCRDVLITDWEKYNCPPLLYFRKEDGVYDRSESYATYEELRRGSQQPETFSERFRDVTLDVFNNASVIHYLGKTKPWISKREASRAYDIFDTAYHVFLEDLNNRL